MPQLSVMAPCARSEDTAEIHSVPEYSVHLDALRGGAALIVLFTHLYLFFVRKPPAPGAVIAELAGTHVVHTAAGSTNFGHKAVIIFFVLSGFFVGGSVVRKITAGQWTWKAYLIHRMTRLWVVLLPALLLGLALDSFGAHHFWGQTTIYNSPLLQDRFHVGILERLRPSVFLGNLFFLQDIFVPPFGSNRPLWSLANEFWYYLAFPLLALSLVPRRALWMRCITVALLGGILVFVGGNIAESFPIWLLGVAVALLPRKVPLHLQRPFWLGSLAIFLAACIGIRYGNELRVDILIGFAFSLLVYTTLHFRQAMANNLYRRSASFLARMSYSLYLTHIPVLFFANAFLVGPRLTLPGRPGLLALAETTTAIFSVALLVHYVFEAQTDRVRGYLEKATEPRSAGKPVLNAS